MRDLKIRAHKTHCIGETIELTAGFIDQGDVRTAVPFEFEKRGLYEVIPAFATIDATNAQVLMDSLWDCGIRPTDGTGSAGSLAATQRHLDDMRNLVGKYSGIRFAEGLK
jgi:hypothetical protein